MIPNLFNKDTLQPGAGAHYYQLTGNSGKLSSFFSTPLRDLEITWDSWKTSNILQRIEILALAIILLVPALVGLTCCKIIHTFTAEKIDSAVYEEEWNNWVDQKNFWLTANPEVFSSFINFCIINQITPEMCPFKFIGVFNQEKLHLFTADGPFYKANTFSNGGKEFLVVGEPSDCNESQLEKLTKNPPDDLPGGIAILKTKYFFAHYSSTSSDWVKTAVETIAPV